MKKNRFWTRTIFDTSKMSPEDIAQEMFNFTHYVKRTGWLCKRLKPECQITECKLECRKLNIIRRKKRNAKTVNKQHSKSVG